MQDNVISLIRLCMWEQGTGNVDNSIFIEMKQHALVALPAHIMTTLQMPDDLRKIWQTEIYQQISYNVNYRHEQATLPVSVPYVILKGTSAAQYYPNPLYRTMGDIDIMPRREDFEMACEQLLQNGFREITDDIEKARGRHRQFHRDELLVEVHAYYAHQNNPQRAKLLDDMIIEGITPNHVLPDIINGLVLIDHINHHMENGLGFRQIIDWMMYVDKCLSDDKWPGFQALVKQTGHEQLAVVTTRMCELYLGLPLHRWCADADPAVCGRLLQYIMDNGNFGRKQEEDSRVSQRFLSSTRTVKGMFRFLQGRGLLNWPAAQRNRFLRPFAWLHQTFRYLGKGIVREDTLAKLKTEQEAARQRNELFDALGINREERGLVKYKKGKYIKN